MFSLICVWINGRVNSREAGDLRRNCGHYDANVMYTGVCGGGSCPVFSSRCKKAYSCHNSRCCLYRERQHYRPHQPDTDIFVYGNASDPCINSLRPRQDGRRFPDGTFELIFLNENVLLLIKISLTFVSNGPINNITTLVQKMAWRRPGDKPLSESMMVRLQTHVCVTRPQ